MIKIILIGARLVTEGQLLAGGNWSLEAGEVFGEERRANGDESGGAKGERQVKSRIFENFGNIKMLFL